MTPDEADKKQEWAGMDGAIAFHMIRRHAYDRSEIGVMMEVWRRANSPAWRDAPTCEGLWFCRDTNGTIVPWKLSADILQREYWKRPEWRWYGPIPAAGDKP